MKKLAAEFIGTFALVFAGTGAIVTDLSVSGLSMSTAQFDAGVIQFVEKLRAFMRRTAG